MQVSSLNLFASKALSICTLWFKSYDQRHQVYNQCCNTENLYLDEINQTWRSWKRSDCFPERWWLRNTFHWTYVHEPNAFAASYMYVNFNYVLWVHTVQLWSTQWTFAVCESSFQELSLRKNGSETLQLHWLSHLVQEWYSFPKHAQCC